jgi:hypothetical protein
LTLRNPELRKLIGRLSGQGLKLLWQPPQVHCPVVALLLSVNDLEPELPSLQDGIALFGFNISMQCPNEWIFSSGVASKKLPQHRLIGRGQHHLSPRIPPSASKCCTVQCCEAILDRNHQKVADFTRADWPKQIL